MDVSEQMEPKNSDNCAKFRKMGRFFGSAVNLAMIERFLTLFEKRSAPIQSSVPKWNSKMRQSGTKKPERH